MPQTNLIPISSSTNGISLANQKMGRQTTTKSQETGKKSKTQQPNKLVELFRQVDNSQQATAGGISGNPNVIATNQFV